MVVGGGYIECLAHPGHNTSRVESSSSVNINEVECGEGREGVCC